jgi:hypothetical protein
MKLFKTSALVLEGVIMSLRHYLGAGYIDQPLHVSFWSLGSKSGLKLETIIEFLLLSLIHTGNAGICIESREEN